MFLFLSHFVTPTWGGGVRYDLLSLFLTIVCLLYLQISSFIESLHFSFHKLVQTGPRYWVSGFWKAPKYFRVTAKLFVLIFIPQIDLIKLGSDMLGADFVLPLCWLGYFN